MQLDRRIIFNEFASEYFHYRPYLPQAFGARLVEALGVQPSARLLEIGCGTGQATEAFREFPFKIVALDIGNELIEYAKRRDYGKLDIEFICSSFEKFDPNGTTFDLAFSCMAIHWIEPSVVYMKAASLLKSGGHLVLINIKRDYPPALRAELDQIYDEFPEIKGVRPSSTVESEASELEREKFFLKKPSLEFTWSIDYTPESYIGLMKTMSPQRSLVPSRQQEYFRKLEAELAKHATLTIPNLVTAELFEKK